MLTRFGRVEGKGLHGLAGYTDLDDLTPAQAASLILERLALNEGKRGDHYTAGTAGGSEREESLTPITEQVGALVSRRGRHLSAKLADGRVLVIGGLNGNGVVSAAEIFNPQTRVFSLTEWFPMDPPAPDIRVIALHDGRLVFGGDRGRPQPLTLVELSSDRVIAKQSTTATTTQHNVQFSMTLLSDGKVLLVGSGQSTMCRGTEVYDPITDSFKRTSDLHSDRMGSHTATQLLDGSVLIVGGNGRGSRRSELYRLDGSIDVAADLIKHRWRHTATRLLSGQVLILGGLTSHSEGAMTSWDSGVKLIETYDRASGYFELQDGIELAVPRWDHEAPPKK